MIGELALRYPGSAAGDRDSERARLRLLVMDTAHLSVSNLGAAIRAGVKLWRFMPTAAEICEQAKDFVAWSKPEPKYEPPIAQPSQALLSDDTDVDALLRDTFAKLSAGHEKLMGVPLQARASSLPLRPAATRTPTEQDYAEIRAQMGR